MNSQWVVVLAFLPVTFQLSLHSDGAEVDADGKEDDPVYDFGGFFEFIGREKQNEEQQLVGQGRKTAETSDLAGPWKAPLSPGDTYSGSSAWPLSSTAQCTSADMTILNDMALKQAKKKLPPAMRAGDFKTGSCYTGAEASGSWDMTGTSGFVPCYQSYFPVSTPCATCIGSVYLMAKHNMSTNCYNLCKGRPHRRDGAHWCWEDCQSCMWYIGKKLSDCYGEPYDMACKYAKELGKEGWFEKNGIDPNGAFP